MAFLRIKDWLNAITAFRTGDVIPVDGPSGTAKMDKDSLLAIIEQTTIDLNDSNNWVDGEVKASTGEIVANDTRVSTKMMPFISTEVLSVVAKTGVSYYYTIYCYDAFRNYLGYKSGMLSIASAVSDYPTAKFFRLGLINVSGVTPVSAANIANIITSSQDPNVFKYVSTTSYDAVSEKFVEKKVSDAVSDATIVYADLNDSNNWVDGGVNSSTGEIKPSDTDRISTRIFPFTENTIISVTPKTGVSLDYSVYCYDKTQSYLGVKVNTSSISNALSSYPTARFFRLGLISISGVTPVSASNITNIATLADSNIYKFEFAEGFDELLNNAVAKNIKDATELYVDLNDSDNWVDGGVVTASGEIDPSQTTRLSTKMFQFSDSVVLSSSKPSGVSWQGNIYCYDKFKKYLGFKQSATSIQNVLSSYPTAVWFRYSLINVSGVTPVSSSNIANIIVFAQTFATKKYVTMPEFQAHERFDKLYEKNWYACGDSFTEGVVSGNPIPSGMYAGEKQVYPYLIGNRTGMEVHNIAVSGSTITYISGVSTSSNCFTYPSTGKLYTIPANAEYITLKFGINDSHKNVPIGTIDDATNTTLYGAWNVAISYLLNKCPFAKIGIIVTNGCDSPEYSQAGKDIAKKWGLAYLDENFGYEVPLLHRVNGKPLVCAEAHQNRLENFRVSVDNTHPNDKAHEFESTFVEAWLRAL